MQNEKQRRQRSICIRLTEKEMLDLDAKVARTNLKRETYVRQVLLGTAPKESPSPATMMTVRQLSAIGNNINQIARVANATGTVDMKKFNEATEKLNEIFSELKGRL